jgi:hypothetical protein
MFEPKLRILLHRAGVQYDDYTLTRSGLSIAGERRGILAQGLMQMQYLVSLPESFSS